MPRLGEREKDVIIKRQRTVNIVIVGFEGPDNIHTETAYFRLPEVGGFEGIAADVEKDIKSNRLVIPEGSTLAVIARGTMTGDGETLIFQKETP